jgi:Nitroreductase family
MMALEMLSTSVLRLATLRAIPHPPLKPFPSPQILKIPPLARPMTASVSTTAVPAPTPASPSASTTPLLNALISRRTYYALTPDSPVPASRIRELAHFAVQHVPSAFNSQTSRLVLLLGADHAALWDEIVLPVLEQVTPPEQIERTRGKIAGLRNSVGTILFFEDNAVVEGFGAQFPLYKKHFYQ